MACASRRTSPPARNACASSTGCRSGRSLPSSSSRSPGGKGDAWHRLLNDLLAELVSSEPSAFSWLASGPLPDAARAARELERALKNGAVGAVVATHVEAANLGELPLDEYWAAAQSLDVPVFLHPAQPAPLPRTSKFALNQIVQYTFDTTLCVGSLFLRACSTAFQSCGSSFRMAAEHCRILSAV